jgi:cation diffusion facilitator CzcD-associated flavoprotein CzcO
VVFQRSAPYVVPRHDRETSGWRRRFQRWLPCTQRPERLRRFLIGEVAARGVTGNRHFAAQLKKQALSHLRSQVADPELLDQCTPDYEIGCKRILISSEWYSTLARDDVTLVTSELEKITAKGAVTVDGGFHDLDLLIWATGFASTDFLSGIKVRGRSGLQLEHVWADGASAYRGMAVSGFPNLFVLYGPNTNLGTNSIIYMLEQQISYFIDLLDQADRVGAGSLEVRAAVQKTWQASIDKRSKRTAFLSGCENWYVEGGRNTNNWPAETWRYGRLMREVNLLDYDLRPINAAMTS